MNQNVSFDANAAYNDDVMIIITMMRRVSEKERASEQDVV